MLIIILQKASRTGSEGHIGLNNGERVGIENDTGELVRHDEISTHEEEHEEEEVYSMPTVKFLFVNLLNFSVIFQGNEQYLVCIFYM